MGQAMYTVVGREGAWTVEHDGEVSQPYATKEAAFEAIVAPASNSLHEGHEVIIRVPGKQSPDEPWLGQQQTPDSISMREPDAFIFPRHGFVPNNPRFPVLLYRSAVNPGTGDVAAVFEALFRDHGWPPQWRDGVFPFHHYHSTAHEALGIARGTATLELGGPGGRTATVAAGDAVVLPAGTGHCRVGCSEDFLVVGAYPPGQDWDLCRDPPSAEMLERISGLAPPSGDPVQGHDGALTRLWTTVPTA